MVWRVSTREKKSIIQLETWKKDDQVATREVGWRWGHFDYEKKPGFDFGDLQSYEQGVLADDLGDYNDSDFTDGCWEEWTWPEDMAAGEAEDLEEAYNDGGDYALVEAGWEHDDTEYWMNGPLDIQYIPDCFQKKPVVIQAVQFTEDNIEELREFCGDALGEVVNNEAHIKTLEDGSESQVQHIATIGDWIIKGIQGEFYPCKPDIFEATYEKTWLRYNDDV